MNQAAVSNSSNVNRIGFYAAILTSVLTLVTFGIAILTPPISGPNCVDACIEYPYLDIVSRFPRDYWWMYPATLLALVFVVLVASIHRYAAEGKRIFSQVGLAFAILSAVLLVADYYIQLSVIQPSVTRGETEGIALWTQYNPHGIFIALEEAGYLMMSLALVCLAPVFSEANRVEKAIRWIFIISFLLTMISLVYFSVRYGIDREYRFEVVVISIDWLVLIITGILLSIVFRRAMQTAP